MDGGGFIGKKLETLRKLFYYRVYLKMHQLRDALLLKYTPPTKQYDLVIIDDAVPKTLSGFRDYEFAFFMSQLSNMALFSIIGSKVDKRKKYEYHQIKTIEQYESSKEQFIEKYKVRPEQMQPFMSWTKIKARLAYVVFMTNAVYLIDYLEEHNIKFILELYPGGGFSVLKEGPTWEALKRVLGSHCLEYVITTQVNSREFVLENKLCATEKVTFTYGAILSPEFMDLPPKQLKYGTNKNTIDICFAAAKYMPKGLDKGYDIFIDMAHLLLASSSVYQFHIIGGFDDQDMPINPAYRSHFHFHGYLGTADFLTFYKDKDIFLAPNRAYTLGKGAFDGFPTATAAEAGLHGLCVLITDPLNLNVCLDTTKDAIFLPPDPALYAENIINLTANPNRIYEIGENGKKALQIGFSYEGQLNDRLSLINKSLNRK